MLKGFIRMQGNPQVKIVIGHLAIGLLATFVERHSPQLFWVTGFSKVSVVHDAFQ
jgi:hypothetical protein